MDSSTPSTPSTPLFAGIDVAKDKLDLGFDDSRPVVTFPNDATGLKRLVEHLVDSLGKVKPALIVVESTGGFERELLDALLDASLPVALVHPGRVRELARALGIQAKTDKLDCRVLARFGKLASPRLLERRSKTAVELEALVTCRRQLLLVRTEQKNRHAATRSKPARKAIDAVLKSIEKQVESLDEQIRTLIDNDDDFKDLDKLLQSVPGVGAVASSTLIAELSELGHGNRRQLASLTGVAPFNADSGNHSGKRSIRGGRATVRSTLYMGTLSAMRLNPVIKPFADRLKAKGKPHKVVITACMRKLITLLNAMIRQRIPWNQLNVVKALAI